MFRVCCWNKSLLSIFVALCMSACVNDPLSEDRDVSTDTTTTGECARTSDCSAPDNATAACVAATCTWTCNDGYHPDNPAAPTGCLADSTLTSCGQTGVDCTAATPSNAIAGCADAGSGFACTYSCDTENGFTQQADGSCFRECVTDSDCPGLSYGCSNNSCLFPSEGGCTGQPAGAACEGPLNAGGEPITGACFGTPVGDLCVPACNPNDLTGCGTSATLCQPLGAIGDPATVAICIPEALGCSTAADCPNGVDACHGGVCVPPSIPACGGQDAGSDCSYSMNGETVEGTCFGVAPPFLCLTECDPLNEVGCANPVNVCQPTGAIGDPATDYVCVPGGTFSSINDCPSGTVAFVDGTCVTPSALAVDCAPSIDPATGAPDFSAGVGNSCDFTFFGTEITGVCFGDGVNPAACVERCDASEANRQACSNPFTSCQPGGVIDPNDPNYFSACIPNTTFGSSADCPTGTHGLDAATGACVAPSNEPCELSAAGDSCSFDFFGTEYLGTCFGAGGPLSCLAECDVLSGTACATPSVCQPTGTIGDPATDNVCIPQGSFATNADCLPGTHGLVDGACVAPSLIACMDGGADEDGNPTFVPDTTVCSFDYFGNTMEGRCFSAGPGIPPVCLAACEAALVDDTGSLVLTDEGGLTEVDCVNPNNSCQALDVLAPGVPAVCIPGNTFTEAAQCPSGTHAADNGDGTFDCVSPSGIACLGKSDLDSCSFDYFGTSLGGQCFQGACLATCDGTIADGDGTEACGNPNSVCQATGAIGDPATGYVCIPSNTFSAAEQCPSGTEPIDNGDGTFNCIPPSGEACVALSDLDACSYNYFGTDISGTCFQGACLTGCDGTIADGDGTEGCSNPNSVCQATGAIGDPTTAYVCIPNTTFTADDTCPSGTFEVNNGDGTYTCIPPSGEACLGLDDFAACSFDYFGTSLTGQCYLGACLDPCDGAGLDSDGLNACDNGTSTCQALGIIGDPTTSYLCTPATTFTADDTCPSGLFELDNGDGTWTCVPPSAIACDGLADLDACSFSYFGDNFSGQCFQGACLDVCDGTTVDGDATEVCANVNSVCQATGAIGDPTTGYVCIPDNTFTEDNTCPSGTFEVDNGDGTYDCIPPDAVGCNVQDATDDGQVNASNLGAPCTFEYFGTSLSGVCFGAAPGALACVDTCFEATVTGTVQVGAAGFEAGDAVATNIGTYNTSGDVWALVSSVGSISGPSEGAAFWGIQDLNNDNGGSAGWHTISVGPFDMSSVGGGTISFDYQSVGFDSTDEIGFLVVTDGASVPDFDVDDSSLVMLQKDTAGQWVSIDFAVGVDVTSATLVLAAKQNGGSDYAGFDNVVVTGNAITLSARVCDNANSSCQATGALGDPATGYVCIPDTTFATAADCPSGTHPVSQADGTLDCIPPDGVGCNVADGADNGALDMSNLGSACSFDYLGTTVSGVCFGAAPGAQACVEICSPDSGAAYPGYAETPCGNPNSTCQATGAIGDPTTAGVCIPANTFTSAADCPSGTHPMDQGDGTFDCIPPSAVGCNVLDVADDGVANMSTLGTVCSYEHFGQTVSGVCFGAAPGAIACVETCAPDDGSAYPGYNETPCGNPNSTCQATGAIGDPTTAGVCIPASTFTSAADCPSGTHPMDQGDGTFDCIPPSAVGCNVLDVVDDGVANMSTLGTVCSYEHFGQTVSGVCFGAAPGAIACVETCAPDDGSAYPGYNETPCGNPNSTCQATGAIGDPTTGGVCIPADTFTVASDCPSGTHAIDQGDGTFDCIPPSAVGCNAADAGDDGAVNMSNLGTPCSFDHFGQTVSGTCYGAAPGAQACVESCSPATVDGTGAVVAGDYCVNTNSMCQATGALGDPTTIGVCLPDNTFATASDCPSGTFPVDNGNGFDCLSPSGIECNGADFADDGAANLSNLGSDCTFTHDGITVSGKCFGTTPGALACLDVCSDTVNDPGFAAFYTPGARPDCANTNSVCQPTGAIGDPTTFGTCAPRSNVCGGEYDKEIAAGADAAAAALTADAASPQGTFGCSEDGASLNPSVVDCINGYVCADPTTGAPTATACNPFAGADATGCGAGLDALCAIPTFAATGAVCAVDGDNDGVDDLDGFCLAIPGDALGASVCLPDCAGLDGGDSSACVAVAGDTAYCQPLEAKGTGLLTDLSDNAAADGSTGYPDPSDIAVCLPDANKCDAPADCDTATSVGCVAGVCETPSLNACAAGGVPGAAAAGTPCETNGTGSAAGFCVPTTDTNGDGAPDAITACLVGCDPTGGSGGIEGDCATANAVCADFTDADPTDGVPGLGLFVCVPAP